MRTLHVVKKVSLPSIGKLMNYILVVKVDNDKTYEIKENELKIALEEGSHKLEFSVKASSLFIKSAACFAAEKTIEITKNQKIIVEVSQTGIAMNIVEGSALRDEKLVYSADLLRSTIRIYEEYCEISGKAGTLNRAKGSKKIYYSDLTSVQFRMPTAVLAGYIQLEYPGSDINTKNPYESENTVVFNKNDDLDLMEAIYNYMDEKITESRSSRHGSPSNTTIIQQSSPAEELKKNERTA